MQSKRLLQSSCGDRLPAEIGDRALSVMGICNEGAERNNVTVNDVALQPRAMQFIPSPCLSCHWVAISTPRVEKG